MTGVFSSILYKNSHLKGCNIVSFTTFKLEYESKGSCAKVQAAS